LSTVAAASDCERPVLEDATEPRPIVLLGVFSAIAIVLTYPSLAHFGTRIPGDGGDSLLILWIMRSVQIGIPHGWHALWDARIFYPQHDTLAYSESFLPVALVHWILRTLAGDVVAVNLVYLGSWVLSSWCMYRLARRFVRHWGAAFVAALAYTYSAIRLVHHAHLQLVVGGALVPLVLVSLLRCLDHPTVRRGLALGATFSALTLTASYYGAIMGIFVVVIVTGWALTTNRSAIGVLRLPLAVAAGVVLASAGPVGIHYLLLEHSPNFRRVFDPASAAHLSDFLRTGYRNPLLSHLPVVGPRSRQTAAGIENRLFPGITATVFGCLGTLVALRRARAGRWRTGRLRELTLVVAAGALTLVLAFGDWFTIGGHRIPLPFALFRDHVPGFAGIRATSRLALGGELALTLLAAVGVDTLLRRWRDRPRTQTVVTVILAASVIIESVITLAFVRVPTNQDDGGLGNALASKPPGAVLELPIESSDRGIAWPYVEAPRQLLALSDGHPRVNGYSGFQPPNFDQRAATLDHFPAPDAIDEARRIGVRYVLVRTSLPSTSLPTIVEHLLDTDSVGLYTNTHAQAIIANLPTGFATNITKLPGGYLIDVHR
jgi:hypothetical protein